MASRSNGRLPESDANADPAGEGTAPKRTAAQAEASRKNGAKSRGPTTPEGQAKAALNATRQGLLARKIAPMPDARLEDREYEHLREQLMREFQPRTISELNAVDVLAFDYIKLGRSAQMQDARFA